MLEVYVCVGSSCHLKGSYHVIKTFKDLIEKNNLSEKVELKASFCLGNCMNGISAKVENEFIQDLTVSNAEDKFMEFVMRGEGK